MGFQRYLNREKKDRDLAEEIQSHLAHEVDTNLARGLSEAEARRKARLRFGNPRCRPQSWHNRLLGSSPEYSTFDGKISWPKLWNRGMAALVIHRRSR